MSVDVGGFGHWNPVSAQCASLHKPLGRVTAAFRGAEAGRGFLAGARPNRSRESDSAVARSNRARGTHAALGRRPRLGETREVRRRGALGRPDAPTQQQHDDRGNRPAHCVRGEGGGGREAPQGSAAAVESAGPGSERPLGAPVLVPGGGSLPVITQRRDREARCRHRRPILGPPRAAAHTTAESLSSSSQ
jgi:hypothetical protein